MRKGPVSLVLVLLLLSALLPVPARAEGGALLQAGDHIYLGEYTDAYAPDGALTEPVSWLVLDAEVRNDGLPGVFLLSQYIVQRSGVSFDESSCEWPDSLAQAWCADFLAAAFSESERAVIPAVSKHEDELRYALYWRKVDLRDEQVFFLSAWEAQDYIGPEGSPGLSAYTSDGKCVYWWLRSGSFIHPDWSGLVLQEDDVHDSLVYEIWGARPAMNLDPAKALLLLPATGQPALGEKTAPSRPADGNWKLLVPDESRQLSLDAVRLEDKTLLLSYSGAAVGKNEYLSLLVKDNNGEILYRMRLAAAEQAEGSLELDIEALALSPDNEIYLYSEHEGGDYHSNTASPLCPIVSQLTLEPGEGSGEPMQLPVVPGTERLLPDCPFTPPAGQRFDHWEFDGHALYPNRPLWMSGDSAVRAVYTDIPVTRILTEPERLSLATGEQAQLQASTLPEDAAETRLHWSSSNSRVCRVDQNGLARGGFPGSAVLTVTAERSEAVAQIPVQVSGGVVPLLLMGMLILLALLLLLHFILTIRRKIRNRWRPKHSEEEWQKPK